MSKKSIEMERLYVYDRDYGEVETTRGTHYGLLQNI